MTNAKNKPLFGWILALSFIASLSSLLSAPMSAQAAVADSPRALNYGLGSNFRNVDIGQSDDLKGMIAKIINIILGFLGITAVLIILYAGFKWMTAAGDADKVKDAQKMMLRAVSGLVVVFAAWVIASFVISRLSETVGTDSGGSLASQSAPEPGALPGSGTDGTGELGSGSLLLVNQSLDSDSDGLTDAEETNIYHTNPNNPDTDADSFPDGQEVRNGYNPNGSGSLTDPANPESCAYLFTSIQAALGNPAQLAAIQQQIRDCCAVKQDDPLCAGL